jgi:cob(I)alamin adenosyltransferase
MDDLRIETYGTVDELNSCLGLARAFGLPSQLDELLNRVQHELFHLGADLAIPTEEKNAFPAPQIEKKHVDQLESEIDRFNAVLSPLENFVLPGGTSGAAALHLSRTVCRRAERLAVRLAREEVIGNWIVPYLNRLSDLLFVLARVTNQLAGQPDVLWNSRL